MHELEAVKVKKTIDCYLSRRMIDNYLRSKGWKSQPGGKWVSKCGHEILGADSVQMAMNELEAIEKRDSYLIFKDISLC